MITGIAVISSDDQRGRIKLWPLDNTDRRVLIEFPDDIQVLVPHDSLRFNDRINSYALSHSLAGIIADHNMQGSMFQANQIHSEPLPVQGIRNDHAQTDPAVTRERQLMITSH